MNPTENILSRLQGVKKSGANKWQAKCPNHDDKLASLSIAEDSQTGNCIIKCHAGCEWKDIINAMGLKTSDLFPPKQVGGERKSIKRKIVKEYNYNDESGKLLYQVLRYEPKEFRQRKPNNSGGWDWSLGTVNRVLYQLPFLKTAIEKGCPIYIVEGEKDCHSLYDNFKLPATTSPSGANKWHDSYTLSLVCAKQIIILPDNDEPGRQHAETVAEALTAKAIPVKVLELPGLSDKQDVSDWIQAGGTKEQLIELVKSCPDWKPGTKKERALDKINLAIETGKAASVYDVIKHFEVFNIGECEDLFVKIKERIPSLDIRELKKSIRNLDGKQPKYSPPEGMQGILITPNKTPDILITETINKLLTLNTPPKLFIHNGKFTRLVVEGKEYAKLESMRSGSLKDELVKRIDYHHFTQDSSEPKHIFPPKDLIDVLLERNELPFPRAKGVIESPVIRDDGSVLIKPGYDMQSGLYYHDTGNLNIPPIPENPSIDDVVKAVETVVEPLLDFPFQSPGDFTNTIAFMLTPLVKHIVGNTPIGIITAPTRGSGKDKLANVISIILTGKEVQTTPLPDNEETLEKTLHSILMQNKQLVFWGNVKRKINSHSLENAITAKYIPIRPYHTQNIIDVVNNTVFGVTGNNVEVDSEIQRRSFYIRINPDMPNPEDRPSTDFRHPNLEQWVNDNRGKLFHSLLVMIRFWYASGKPEYDIPAMGSFEEWVRVVGNILAHSGIGDLLGNREAVKAQYDIEAVQWAGFLEALYEHFGEEHFTASELAEVMKESNSIKDCIPDDLSYAFKSGNWNSIAIGRKIRGIINKKWGKDSYCIKEGTKYHNAIRYRIDCNKTDISNLKLENDTVSLPFVKQNLPESTENSQNTRLDTRITRIEKTILPPKQGKNSLNLSVNTRITRITRYFGTSNACKNIICDLESNIHVEEVQKQTAIYPSNPSNPTTPLDLPKVLETPIMTPENTDNWVSVDGWKGGDYEEF